MCKVEFKLNPEEEIHFYLSANIVTFDRNVSHISRGQFATCTNSLESVNFECPSDSYSNVS